MKLTFHGAAGGVTGSQHKLESNGATLLLDCGMFQGRRKEAEKLNREMPFPARSIDAVVLSHAHIDHSGRLPLLVREGFSGPIYATPATIDLCAAMLRDTAHIAESDAEFVNRHHPDMEPVEPLYTRADADATMPLFRPVHYRKPVQIAGGLTLEFFDAGTSWVPRSWCSMTAARSSRFRVMSGGPGCRSFAIPNRCRRSTI